MIRSSSLRQISSLIGKNGHIPIKTSLREELYNIKADFMRTKHVNEGNCPRKDNTPNEGEEVELSMEESFEEIHPKTIVYLFF